MGALDPDDLAYLAEHRATRRAEGGRADRRQHQRQGCDARPV
jgi:hypothetical protein